MVDIFMIIVAIIAAVVLLLGIGMIIVYMQHPDDANTAWLPKIVVLISLWVACANVLILPFDVTNSQTGGGLNLNLFWSISIYASAIMLLIFIPFAYFYYENDNDPNDNTDGCCGLIPGWNTQLCEGIKWALGFLFCFSIVLVIMYIVMPYADIPVTYRSYKFDGGNRVSAADASTVTTTSCSSNDDCASTELEIEIKVTFEVYVMALLAFLGWFLFVVFAGMGLPALPFDLFNAWKYRPKPIPLNVYATEKGAIGKRAEILVSAGEAIKNDELNSLGAKPSRKEKREQAETFHRYENAVYLLKKDYYHLQTAYKLRGGNPFWAWIKLFLSIVGGSISLMWIIHICVYMLPSDPLDPFLNNLFVELTIPGFPLFGVCAFAFYAFWLLLATIKGNFRFGLRIPFCRVFPMEISGTMMNSFLANSWLILISSIVVVQFCALAFPVYARNTEIDLLFGTQIRYLRFFTYFFDNNVFIYALLVFFLLACFVLILCPRNSAQQIEDDLEKIMKEKGDNISRKELVEMGR